MRVSKSCSVSTYYFLDCIVFREIPHNFPTCFNKLSHVYICISVFVNMIATFIDFGDNFQGKKVCRKRSNFEDLVKQSQE
jgi:hypothetical protein